MSLAELLRQGGFTMAPLVLCSVTALAVFLKKALDLKRARLRELAWLDGVLAAVQAGELGRAHAACGDAAHPAARVAEATLSTLQRRPDRAEAEARRVGGLELQRLETGLGLLAFIAQVAPLLGLLGTVLGMVDMFVGLEGAGLRNVNVSQLSSGIWKALLTTAAGLVVAVPTLAAHAYLASRSDRVRLVLTDTVQRILNSGPAGEADHGVR